MSKALQQPEISEHAGRNNTATGPIKDTDNGYSFCVRSGGRPGPSLNDFAEQFESLLHERNDFRSRLSAALDENSALVRLQEERRADFEREQGRLNSEITSLQSQLSGRLQSVLAAKDKLMREEYERKFQELTVEVKQERKKCGEMIEQIRKQMAGCICRGKKR